MNAIATLDENVRIRGQIEEAILEFLEELFNENISSKKQIKLMTIRPDGSKGSISFLAKNPKPFACHLSVLYQIHRMLLIGQKATKRDLFYEGKDLFDNQPVFNRSLAAVCKLLGTSRRNLRVVGSSRGFAIGDLCLYDNGVDASFVDFSGNSVAILEKLMEYRQVRSSADVILVVEKDATFQKMIDENFMAQYPQAILVTGRGYPDICTREFLKWLSTKIFVRILALMDADPYGIEIYLTYKYGSHRGSSEAGQAHLPQIELIGLLPSEAPQLPITNSHCLPLLAMDFKRLWSVLKRLEFLGETELIQELNVMQNAGYKLELEAVSSITPNFLCGVYLKRKFNDLL